MGYPKNSTLLLLPSAARTTAVSGDRQINSFHKGLLIIIDATAESATAEVTPKVQAYDPTSDAWYDYWTAATAISATGDYTYLFYPGIVATDANTTEAVSLPLPHQWRFATTVADADSLTYSVSCQLLI